MIWVRFFLIIHLNSDFFGLAAPPFAEITFFPFSWPWLKSRPMAHPSH